jgi:Glycosyltransferase GT-D fold
MWQHRLKKLIDNPCVIFTFVRTHLYYRFIADTVGTTYPQSTLNGAETFKAITEKDQSIIRSGDGTVGYLLGASIYFNNWHFRYNRAFARKLRQVLKNPGDTNILFCYPFRFLTKTKADFIKDGIESEWSIWMATKVVVRGWLKPERTYGDAFVFHPRYNPGIDFALLKCYLDTKHVVIITSNTERLKNIKLGRSITLIEGPSSDAWQVYEDLEAKAYTAISKQGWQPSEVLIMVSAAEAAKVMVYDFAKAGYTAWDTGQFFDLAAKEISALSLAQSAPTV